MTRHQGLAALALFLSACGGGSTPVDGGGGTTDTGPTPVDAAPDAAPTPDVGTDAGPLHAPNFRNANSLSDPELAHQALALMGAPEAGGSGSCHDCHGITRASIQHFREISDTAWTTCFSDLAVTTPAAARTIVQCFQDATHNYTTGNLGIFATGATFPWFQFVFQQAFGASWNTEYMRFVNRVQQSPAPHPALTQSEFDLLTEWFLRGTPQVNAVLPPPDGPGMCTSYVDLSVATIVANGAATGWGARNAEASILMHGCAGAATAADCLASYPRVTTTSYGALWETPGTHQRVLFDIPYRTSYWTRSSADGRFVAHGGGMGSGASIIDLQRGVVIGADAAYDPGFFPDNSGFMFQGTPAGTGICAQTVLSSGTPTHITFGEAGCSHPSGVGLYQHVGASLDGGDYFIVNSAWSGDPGDANADPVVFADAGSTTTLLRFTNTGAGTAFSPGGSTTTATPWEGNVVISPTMRLLVGQLADATGNPIGYVLHRIDLTRDATGRVTSVALPEIARYCVPGGKAAFSLDDRWLVTHHRATDADAVDLGFTGASDPGFAAFRGVSNVYLIDLVTGRETRVTNMQPGQRALFPHFRSDGWLYFLVRGAGAAERLVATDAPLVLR
jgi:hypothetical protein